MKQKSFYFYIGTVAELIKLAPVIKEMKHRDVDFKIISTGQNILGDSELKNIFGEIKVDYNLSTKANLKKSSVINFLIWSIKAFINTLLIFKKTVYAKNAYIIVHGDTVSSAIGAIAAKLTGVKVIHIESGLRSFNFLAPFPEEISRVIVSQIADLHFCPNEWSVNNLNKISGEKVNTKANTVYESIQLALKKKRLYQLPKVLKNRKYFLLAVHRQEHILFEKDRSKDLIKYILKNMPEDVDCLFLMHKLTEGLGISKYTKSNRVISIPRQRYGTFVNIMNNAEFMITDGGSNQEEAYYLGKPCLILRDVTERVEGLEENIVLSKSKKRVIKDFMKNYKKYNIKPPTVKSKPSKIIVDKLLKL